MKFLVEALVKKTTHLVFVFMVLALTQKVARSDVPAVHGMLLFGQKTTYASHLPMFHHPHDYQLIMELKLANAPRSETLEAYELLKNKGETLFTLVPEKMDLTQVMKGEKVSFRALIFQGHFERGGNNLGPVTVTVHKILYSKKLDGSQAPELRNKYLVIGQEGEYYAAHVIEGRPSFDAILRVDQPYETHYTHCRTRTCSEPLTMPIHDSKLPLVVTDLSALPEEGEELGTPAARINVQKILYLEEAELQH